MNTEIVGEREAARAVELLTRGEPVALPTETVYGLAADALRADAVAKIFEAKERPFFDPLIVHLPSRDWLDRLANIPEESRRLVDALIEKFWPGPLTLVLPRQAIVPDLVTAGLETVAVRMSGHPVFREVIEKFGKPLAAPSANRFGRISPTTAQHVYTELNNRIPLIVDGGPTEHGIESTIVAVDGSGLRLLRAGPITPEEIGCVWMRGDPGARVEAPGQLQGHYAPGTPLRLLPLGGHARAFGMADAGLLAWQTAPAECGFREVEILSSAGDLREAAATLFAKLRKLDEAGLQMIIAESVPEAGLGIAIMDRLRKAAGEKPRMNTDGTDV